ncbi:hypothetical protein Y032_0015g2543 [Ancylostoma ceylanicum]|uniref:Reverse transcriptase domain-containing protein n=1 Tax=Ancylostoma ceylanicum TaxID=53326 RepID=A0A016V6E2_9BILA|nr:hypothetical protein Y032_0015g2543 [Ancylostoma ceylanicum]
MVFTKLLRPLLFKWRSCGINIAVYLDDGLIWADSAHRCEEAALVVKSDLINAGFSLAEVYLDPTPEAYVVGPRYRFVIDDI